MKRYGVMILLADHAILGDGTIGLQGGVVRVDDTGRLSAVGTEADLLVVQGNAAADITAPDRAERVYLAGQVAAGRK